MQIYFAFAFVLLFFMTISAGSAKQTVFVSMIEKGPASNGVSVQGYMPVIKSSLPPLQPPGVGPIWGVNFISSAEERADDRQYGNGVDTGASWNRWPLYWFNIETNPNFFDWSKQDETVMRDIAFGFKIDAILLGTPSFYTTSALEDLDPDRPSEAGPFEMKEPEAAAPAGLYDSIFTDGTDVPGPGKSINPSNVWARGPGRSDLGARMVVPVWGKLEWSRQLTGRVCPAASERASRPCSGNRPYGQLLHSRYNWSIFR